LGLAALNWPGAAAAGRGSAPGLGNLLLAGVAVTEALFSALGKQVSRALSPLAIATYVTAWGLAMFAPMAVWEALHFDFGAAPWRVWVPVFYYGIFVGAGAFLLWYWGLARVPAGTAAVFLGLMPVSAVALSVAVLGERLLWSHLAGAVGVLLGIACITLLPRGQGAEPTAD
jgi:drug/metabolite transporter (DMT)-like permease